MADAKRSGTVEGVGGGRREVVATSVAGIAPSGVGPRQASSSAFERSKKGIVAHSLLQRATEVAFEEIYKRDVGATEFRSDDHRRTWVDSDRRMVDESGRPVWRINIKVSGLVPPKAAAYVGLEPDDCFRLATYKIHAALQSRTRSISLTSSS
jgi:hypothetical protein